MKFLLRPVRVVLVTTVICLSPALISPAGSARASTVPTASSAPVSSPEFHDHETDLIAIWPVMGASRLSSRFGTRQHPTRHSRIQHKGIDLAAPKGSPVLAISAGVVVFAGWRRGYGRTVDVLHANGWMTRYAHAHKLLVKKGDEVLQGQYIAQVGSTGDVTGPHLHLEVWKDNRPINPLSLYPKGYAQVMQNP